MGSSCHGEIFLVLVCLPFKRRYRTVKCIQIVSGFGNAARSAVYAASMYSVRALVARNGSHMGES